MCVCAITYLRTTQYWRVKRQNQQDKEDPPVDRDCRGHFDEGKGLLTSQDGHLRFGSS